MKWCIEFPEENLLLVRPCLTEICMGVKPAAKLLSVLLYRYSIRKEHQQDAKNINEVRTAQGNQANQDTTFRIFRTQAQLIDDMCDEITAKTLHDTAIPTLQLLGYLDVDESPVIHCYDIHLDVVTEAIETLKGDRRDGTNQLEKFLIAHLQLEKFLIELQLEKLPIDKKNFSLALEKILIANRNFSNNKRGRKPSPKAALEGNSKPTKITKITREKSNKDSLSLSSGEDEQNFRERERISKDWDTPTEPDLRAVKPPHLTLVPPPEPPPEPEPLPASPKPAKEPPIEQQLKLQFNTWRIKRDAKVGDFDPDALTRGKPANKKLREHQDEIIHDLVEVGSCRCPADVSLFRWICAHRQQMYFHDPHHWSKPANQGAIDEERVRDNFDKFDDLLLDRVKRKNGNGHAPGSVSGAPHVSGKVV